MVRSLSLSLPLRNPGHFLKIGNQDPQNLSRHFLNNYQGLLTYRIKYED